MVVFVDTSTAMDALIADLKKNPNVDTETPYKEINIDDY